jgi:hypothetical protein
MEIPFQHQENLQLKLPASRVCPTTSLELYLTAVDDFTLSFLDCSEFTHGPLPLRN